MTRRTFLAALAAGQPLDAVLRDGIQRLKIPAVAAAVATPDKTLYSGAFGAATTRSLFQIASMTKAITTVAALQLVERGKLSLDGPVSAHLPALEQLQILGDDSRLRPATTPVTLRHLLTHTAGFAYSNWNETLARYTVPPGAASPLMTEPGTRWEYGTNLDWTGRLIETVSGQTLETYFQRHILKPLGMADTSYLVPASKRVRLVRGNPPVPYVPTKVFNGGGGLYSTTSDYVRFMQMILNGGKPGILGEDSLRAMQTNQIGALGAGKMKTANPSRSADVDFHPGVEDGFTFGFLRNATAYEGGRSAGSLAWAGIFNTFYWIDPARSLCATVMMQFLPFCDPAAMTLLREFERAVYENV